jgi:hypothetical protein
MRKMPKSRNTAAKRPKARCVIDVRGFARPPPRDTQPSTMSEYKKIVPKNG